MKQKLCFFLGDITRSGGTERVASQIANALAGDGAYDVCLLSLVEQNKAPFYPIDPAIPRYSLGERWIKPGPGYLPLIGKLRTFLREKNIDVVIDVDIVLDVLSLPAARFLGTKVISWEHFNAEFELSVGYRRWILRYSLPRSDYVVVLTKADRDVYRDRLGRRERIAQIYNPLDKSDEAYDPHRKKQIVSVGRLAAEKGMDKLMRVEERAALERFIRETHLENRLILLGTVADVDAWLRQASILVSTSEYEGLGMNILEARRRGVPCVSFAVPTGPQEIIRDGVDGYLVPPFDCDEMAGKINRLIEEPSLRERFARQALASLGEFETTRVIGQWKRLLAELADGTR